MPQKKTNKRTAGKRGMATRAVHEGESRHGVSGPVVSPITQSANFTFSNVEEMKAWVEGRSKVDIYTRYGNPTLRVAEAKLAALEETDGALVAASGMAAITSSILSFVEAGDEIIATRSLYGGTYRFMRDMLPRFDVKVHFVKNDLEDLDRFVNDRTRVLYTETPTNPTLQIVDLRKAAKFAQQHGLVSMVDNTFATPIFQKPAALGFDLVLHSATKYLNGHSDLIAGAVAGKKKLLDKIRATLITLGGTMDPSACYLLIRGMRTLETRVRRQEANALAVARFLEKHSKVARLHYPGLKSHPDYQLARRQMSGFGAMMALDIKGGLRAATRFGNRIRLFLLAASLGGGESLAVLPLYTSHHGLSDAELKAAGVSPGTVRLSIGIEDPDDLIADLKQALV